MGPIGAECDKTFTSARRSIEKKAWDKERVGLLCTDSSNVANWRATVLKFCGDTKLCSPEMMKVVDEVSARMESLSEIVTNDGKELTPVTSINRTLRNGDIGPDVQLLQKTLSSMGYVLDTRLVEDTPGTFGYATFKQVQALQTKNGLAPDGIVGPKTAALLSIAKGDGHVSGALFHGTGSTIIPFAIQNQRKMKTRGIYEGGYPKGVVIHTTEGHWETLQNAKDVVEDGINKGYTYLCTSATGELIQAHPLNAWGNHAGESAWKRALVGGVSDDLIGIENCGPGRLTLNKDGTFTTYFGTKIDIEKHGQPRYVDEVSYGCPSGWYLPFTRAQQMILTATIVWLYQNDPTGNFQINNVLGHHECSGMIGIGYWRKSDPGGALEWPMEGYRKYLKGIVGNV